MLHADQRIRAAMLDFINRSFRDVADQDYVAARMLYRCDLKLQFLWAALQAMEKYFKSILLYNGRSAKGYGHDVVNLFSALPSQIPDIPFEFPAEMQDFVQYLGRLGTNRYFERSYFMTGDELFALDAAVWHVRRYSQYLRGTDQFSGRADNRLASNLARIHDKQFISAPHRFAIFNGYLERVLSGRHGPEQRQSLIWKNFYYGRQAKHQLATFTFNSGSANPAHSLYPEILPELEKLVDLSAAARNAFRNLPCGKGRNNGDVATLRYSIDVTPRLR